MSFLVWTGHHKRKLCVALILIPSAPADSPHLSHLATLTSHSSLSSLTVWVCRLRMGPFPWFHSRAIRMCLLEKEFGNVFLKQTGEGRKKKGENGSASVFWRARDSLCLMWGDFFLCFLLLVLKLCACIASHYQPLSFSTFQNSEGFIGLTVNAGKSEIYVLDRRTERKGRKKDRAEGRTQVKTGLFEAAGLLKTVLLLLTLTFK